MEGEAAEEERKRNNCTLILVFQHTAASLHQDEADGNDGNNHSMPTVQLNEIDLLTHWLQLAPSVTSRVLFVQHPFDQAIDVSAIDGRSGVEYIQISAKRSIDNYGRYPHMHALADAIEYLGYATEPALVADAEKLLEPGFNLDRLVRHALLKQADALLVTNESRGVFVGNTASVAIHATQSLSSMPRVAGIVADALQVHGGVPTQSHSPSQRVHAMVPLVLLQPNTLQLAKRWVDELECEQTPGALQHFMKWLHSQEPAGGLHAVQGRYILSVSTFEEYNYTDRLLRFVAEEQSKAAARAATSAQPTKRAHSDDTTVGCIPSATDMIKSKMEPSYEDEANKLEEKRRRMLNRAIDLEKLLPVFELRYEQAKQVLLKSQRAAPMFADANKFQQTKLKQKQHPCFETTTNATYGSKEPLQQELPEEWHGLNGRFTTGFSNIMFKRNGLETSRDRSNVHRAFEEI